MAMIETFMRLSARTRASMCIAAIWMALFAPQLFQGQMFVRGDARVYRPFAEYSRARWTEHRERTHWNPFVYGGLPATASLADQRPQYLPDVLIDVYERTRIGNAIPQGAPIFVHLLGMLAMAWLAAALCRAGAAGMVWAGAAWGLMPHLLVPYVFGHDAQLVTCSLMPVMLLGVHHVVAASSGFGAWAASLAVALTLGVQVLTGHPQFVVYSCMLAAGFGIERVLAFRRAPRLVPLAAAGALGAAMSMVVWWPAMLYSAHSFRGGFGSSGVTLEEVTRYSLAWRELLSSVWPQAVGGHGATYWGGLVETDYPRFFGTAVVTFAAVGLLAVRRRRGDAVVFMVAAGVIAVAVALGTRLGPLYDAIYAFVPFFSKFRVPSSGLVVAQFGLVLLSARVFAAERATLPHIPRAAVIAGFVVLLLAGVGLATGVLDDAYARYMQSVRPDRGAEDAMRAAHFAGWDLMARALLAAAAVWLATTMLRGGAKGWTRYAGAGAVVLVLLDLASVTWPQMSRATGPVADIAARSVPALAEVGAAEPSARISSTRVIQVHPSETVAKRQGQEFYVNDWIYWRARALGGDHGALPDRWRLMGDLPRSYRAMLALGVVYMSGAPGPAWDARLFEPVRETPDEVVYRLRRGLGRAYAVRRVIALRDDRTVVAGMMTQDFDPSAIALTADASAAGEYAGSDSCAIRWIEDDPDRIVLETNAHAPAFVVVADTHFPGWTVAVDGVAVPLHRVNQLLRGVAVPAGTHRVEMRYVPEGWTESHPVARAGMAAWGIGALALGGLAWRRRRTAGTKRPSS